MINRPKITVLLPLLIAFLLAACIRATGSIQPETSLPPATNTPTPDWTATIIGVMTESAEYLKTLEGTPTPDLTATAFFEISPATIIAMTSSPYIFETPWVTTTPTPYWTSTVPTPTHTPATPVPSPTITKTIDPEIGRVVYFGFPDSGIYVMEADGSNETSLTEDYNYYFEDDGDYIENINKHPKWSPDGSQIAFVSDRDGRDDVYQMDADGSSQTRLTFNQTNVYHLTWSPDGSLITFAASLDFNLDIFLIDPEGNNQTRLTDNQDQDLDPVWSPDGSRIAFTSNRDGQDEIYVMDADGGGQTRLTFKGGKAPAWSPDGTRIAYLSYQNGRYEVYVLDADGSRQTRLTSSAGEKGDLAWSPDGSQIAFASTPESLYGIPDIYLMDADGRNQVQLTLDGGKSPVWSPDGAWIAFVGYYYNQANIFIMDLVRGSQIHLSNAYQDIPPDWWWAP